MSRRVRFTPFVFAGLFVCGALPAEAADVPFAPPALVAGGATGTVDIATADVDGDGDRDLVSFDQYAHVLWTENVAGDGTVWSPHTIGTDADIALDVAVARPRPRRRRRRRVRGLRRRGPLVREHRGRRQRLDDRDRRGYRARAHRDRGRRPGRGRRRRSHLGHVRGPHRLAREHGRRRLGLDPADGAPRGLFTASVDIHDVDGDGDLDVLAAAIEADVVTWHENVAGDGSVFATHTIATGADGASDVRAADVDRDGDLDAVAILRVGNAVLWYENTAGDGSAWAAHTISTVSTWGRAVFLDDVDVDGDLDVVSAWGAPLGGGTVGLAWHENLGAGASWVTRTLVSETTATTPSSRTSTATAIPT